MPLIIRVDLLKDATLKLLKRTKKNAGLRPTIMGEAADGNLRSSIVNNDVLSFLLFLTITYL